MARIAPTTGPVAGADGGLSAPRSPAVPGPPPESVFAKKKGWVIFVGALVIATAGGGAEVDCNCDNVGDANGFHAMVVMTGDADWEEKWQTIPPEQGVHFGEVSALREGDRAWIPTFLANPEIGGGRFEVLCDLKITRPNGTEIIQPQYPCASEMPVGKVEAVRLTNMMVEVIAEPGDPKGVWTAEIGVTDALRGVRVPLALRYELLEGGG